MENRGPEIEFEDGVPMPPMVRPVVLLQGTDYEMGCQYYRQLIEIFGPEVSSYEWNPILPWTRSPMKRGEYTQNELRELGKYEATIKKYIPEMIDFMAGMAEGATDAGVPLSYQDILNFFVKRWTYIGSVGEQPYPPLCSGFAAWGSATKDRRLIFGGTGDLEMTVHEVLIMAFPDTGNNFLCNTATGPAYHPGMNNRGLAYVHHGGCRPGGPVCNCGHLPSPPYAIPMPLSTMHILRFANNADEAKEMTLSFPVLAGGLFVDIRGNNWCIECTELPAIRQAGYLGERDFLYATNNGLCKEVGLKGWTYVPHGGWVGPQGEAGDSITRNVSAWNLFNNYHGEVDVEFAKMVWRFPGTEVAGLDERYIGSRSNSTPSVGIPDDGDEGIFYLATGSPIRSQPLKWGYFRANNTYAFMKVRLAADPKAVVEDARKQAWNDVHRANEEIAKLTIWDPPFAPLDAIYDKAVKEMVKGSYYAGKVLSEETTGNDTLCALAKALRYLTRAQCLARKAYNALVPPARTPEDLGLQPWFGNWAEWETWRREPSCVEDLP